MARARDSYGTLVVSDTWGDTLRERQVAVWPITDAGSEEDENGIYISLSSTADLERTISGFTVGVTIREEDLLKAGYVRIPNIANFMAETDTQPEEVEAVVSPRLFED